MNLKNYFRLLSLFSFLFFYKAAFSQSLTSLNGKKIYLSITDEITLKFHSSIDQVYFTNTKASDEIKIKKATLVTVITLSTDKENFSSTNLMVKEGKNLHRFVLVYKEKLDDSELLYDFSDLNKLKELVQQTEIENKNHDEIVDTNQTQKKSSDNKDIITSAPVQIVPNVQINNLFNEAISKADTLYNKRKLGEALQLYKTADSIKPGNRYCKSQIELIEILIRNRLAEELNKAIEFSYQKHMQNASDARYKKRLFPGRK